MSETTLASPTNVGTHPAALAQDGATRTVIVGPNIALPGGIGEILPVVGLTGMQLFELKWRIQLLQEGSSIALPLTGRSPS